MKPAPIFALLLASSCGGSKPAPTPPENAAQTAPGDAPAGSGSAEACPEYLNCMPPTDGPCPPPGFKERCPNTAITY